jgi:plastocyanin
MRRPLLLSLAAIALLAAACAPSQAPGWTFAPPTIAPPSQPAASGDASPLPSAPENPTPVPGGQTPPSAGAVQVSALNVAFEQAAISAPAGAPFVIHFDNKDAGITHNVEIKDASGMSMFKGDIVAGPIAVDYKVQALAAGAYQFVCTVHPNMVGTLKVGG